MMPLYRTCLGIYPFDRLMRTIFVFLTVLVLLVVPCPTQAAPVTPGVDFSRFPRPTRDNGRGIHWVPTILGQPPDVVDRFLGEADQMGIRWIKLMQADQATVEHTYLLRGMAQRGMMPVLRVYKRFNAPYEHLAALVKAAKPLGVVYYELYNEPNLQRRGGRLAGQRLARRRRNCAALVACCAGGDCLRRLSQPARPLSRGKLR